MKNLTNAQLEILTNAFMKKVDAKLEVFKTTPGYQELVDEAMIEINYDEVKPLITKLDAIDILIKEATEERHKLFLEVKSVSKLYETSYAVPSVKHLDKALELKAIDKAANKFPSINDVQSEIILMSIQKSDDILGALAEKFEL